MTLLGDLIIMVCGFAWIATDVAKSDPWQALVWFTVVAYAAMNLNEKRYL